jgi:hypothetical protein
MKYDLQIKQAFIKVLKNVSSTLLEFGDELPTK